MNQTETTWSTSVSWQATGEAGNPRSWFALYSQKTDCKRVYAQQHHLRRKSHYTSRITHIFPHHRPCNGPCGCTKQTTGQRAVAVHWHIVKRSDPGSKRSTKSEGAAHPFGRRLQPTSSGPPAPTPTRTHPQPQPLAKPTKPRLMRMHGLSYWWKSPFSEAVAASGLKMISCGELLHLRPVNL